MLKFTTTDPISIKWEIFDPGFPGQFTKGVFETDIRFGNESHSIGLNGHSAGDLWDINATNESEFLVGEFDYLASNGRLADIVQFTFVGNTLEKVPRTSFYLDNVRLELE